MQLNSTKKPFQKIAMKRLSLCVAIALFCESTANAGLSAALNGMFMQNGTSPGVYSSMDRGGYTFGGASAHWPVQNINLVSFDPPHINGGCGGIDLYGGSFSFINGAQIVALFKQIVANAAGALFQIAIQSISPSLSKIMNEFQTVMQKMNSAMKNTCAIGSAIGNSIGSDLGMQGANAAQGVGAMVQDAQGSITDMFAGINSSPAQTMSNITSSAPANPNVGNFTWRALSTSSAEKAINGPYSGYVSSSLATDREVLMSFLGTTINNVGTSPTDTSTTAASPTTISVQNPNAGPITTTHWYAPVLHIINIYEGSDPNNPLFYYGCNDDSSGTVMPPNDGCATLDWTRQWSMVGTRVLAQAFLFGTPSGTWTTTKLHTQVPDTTGGLPDGKTLYSNGILYSWANCSTSGCSLNSYQTDFIQALPAPIVNLMMSAEMAGGPGVGSLGAILSPLTQYIGYGYALSIAESIRQAINAGLSGASSVKAKKTPEMVSALAEIDSEIDFLRSNELASSGQLKLATDAISEMIKANPSAYMSIGAE